MRNRRPRACEEARPLLEMAADRLLDDPAEKSRLERHLAACSACRASLAREASLTASLASFTRIRVSVDVESRVMEAIRAEAARQARPAAIPAGRLRRLLAGAGATGAAAIAVELAALAGLVWAAFRLPALVPAGLSSLWDLTRLCIGTGWDVISALCALFRPFADALSSATRPLASLGSLAPTVAALFFGGLLVLTFLAVRHDLQRGLPVVGGAK